MTFDQRYDRPSPALLIVALVFLAAGLGLGLWLDRASQSAAPAEPTMDDTSRGPAEHGDADTLAWS